MRSLPRLKRLSFARNPRMASARFGPIPGIFRRSSSFARLRMTRPSSVRAEHAGAEGSAEPTGVLGSVALVDGLGAAAGDGPVDALDEAIEPCCVPGGLA